MDSGSGNASGSSADSAKPASTPGDANNRTGCGCVSASTITIRVTPTTGGQFDLSIAKSETIENLKKVISKKLKVPKERICLLNRDRQLRDGTLQDNQLMDGSRLTLLPIVETGLLAQRPEQSVMQALESLNDAQVNDFLSGKAPLNLTMRLGDHMMLIQLQLSTVTPSGSRRGAAAETTTASPAASTSATTSPRNYLASSLTDVISGMAKNLSSQSKASTSTTPSSLKISTSPGKRPKITTVRSSKLDPMMEFASSFLPSEGVTIKETTLPEVKEESKPLTSLLSADSPTPETYDAPKSPTSEPTTPVSAESILKSLELATKRLEAAGIGKPPAAKSETAVAGCKCDPPTKPVLDTRALAEASRNLTQTLKQLSSEVLTSSSDNSAEESARARGRQGAIIESMHHHGKGVYSGTFSGTLNPALQDRYGRPKRDISTIIHILNDLLCATPQYRRHARQGASITLEAAQAKPDKEEAMEFGEDSLLRENQATRGKLEQLRLVMEQRRARRRARRDARAAPYTTQWSAKSETLNASTSAGSEPMEADCEMAPSGPVVA